MRILVIDDNPLHHASARQTLGGHEVTIVGTYDEAHKLLEEPRAHWKAVNDELERRGFKNPYAPNMTAEERAAARAEEKRIEQELCPPPPFEAVLSDLLMPASRMTMGPEGEKYIGQEMPVGFALSLMAALHAKYVAVVTATNHHNHPASAMLDAFESRCTHEHDSVGKPPRFVINGARVGFYHAPMTFVEGTTCPDCGGSGDKEVCYCVERNAGVAKPDCDTCKGAGRQCWTCRNTGKQWGKDWGKVLTHITAG